MPEPATPTSVANQAEKSATRLLRMVHELHRAGYQRIRFSSGMAPSGVYWRCSITHAGNMSDDGLRVINHLLHEEVASYSTGSLDRYFNWPDAPGRSAEELATMFTHRFPCIVELGKGRDWSYSGWLTEIIGRVERGGLHNLPVFSADYPLKIDPFYSPPPVRKCSPIKRIGDAIRRTLHR